MSFSERDDILSPVERTLGYAFHDASLLLCALTRRSYWHENRDSCRDNNERMEFLGDAVLGLVAACALYRAFPDDEEGELQKKRAGMVNRTALAQTARRLGLAPFIRMGKGDDLSGCRDRDSILADTVEAVLGAVYLDAGIEEAEKVFSAHFGWLVQKTEAGESAYDYRTLLQERIQATIGVTPRYRLLDEWGEDHCKTFLMGVLTGDEMLGKGSGRNKREAAQNAARDAWERFEGTTNPTG